MLSSLCEAMRPIALLTACTLGGLVWPTSASAFFDTLTITPTVPVAGQSYRFSLRVGGCHAVVNTAPLEYEVQGRVIRLTMDVADNSASAGFCNFPVHTAFFDLEGLPQGAYRLDVWRRRSTQPLIPLTFVESIDFTVAAGTPAPTAVPVGGLQGWLALAFSIFAAGVLATRMRRARA